MQKSANAPAQSILVFSADDIVVSDGANLGDTLSFASEIDLDDVYQLRPGARRARLSVSTLEGGALCIAQDTEIGKPGANLHLDCCVTMMTVAGVTSELIVIVEVDEDNNVANIYALPLVQMEAKIDYALVGVDRQKASRAFAQVACVSFTRGTRITMASGMQKPIEDLRAGDQVLTRDDGPQEIRWIGQNTVRAVGDFAPIRIKAGVLHNEGDLVVSSDHRLFIYQRYDALGAGRKEVLVRARHLVNDDTVIQQQGGFVDYFQLLFDKHYIIFAEGISAETFLVDSRTRGALPTELSESMGDALPGHDAPRHLEYEVNKALLDRPDAASLLKRASTR